MPDVQEIEKGSRPSRGAPKESSDTRTFFGATGTVSPLRASS